MLDLVYVSFICNKLIGSKIQNLVFKINIMVSRKCPEGSRFSVPALEFGRNPDFRLHIVTEVRFFLTTSFFDETYYRSPDDIWLPISEIEIVSES